MSTDSYRTFDPWRPAPVREGSRKQIVESYYFNIDRVSFDSPGIGQFERYILQENNGETIGVLAITDDGRIPFVEQYRIPSHRWTLEIPAGHANSSDERALQVAKRTLREKVGFEAGHITQINRFINTPSFSNQHTALYFANDLTPIDSDESESDGSQSKIRFYTMDEAYQMVLNGTIVDAKSIIGILLTRCGVISAKNDEQ